MRKLMLVIAVGAIVLAWYVPTRAAEPPSQPNLAAENARLRARVADLEKQVQVLRDELARLRPVVPQPFSLTPRITPAVPRDWQQREFNGTTWYMVPLASEARDAANQPPAGYVVPSTGR